MTESETPTPPGKNEHEQLRRKSRQAIGLGTGEAKQVCRFTVSGPAGTDEFDCESVTEAKRLYCVEHKVDPSLFALAVTYSGDTPTPPGNRKDEYEQLRKEIKAGLTDDASYTRKELYGFAGLGITRSPDLVTLPPGDGMGRPGLKSGETIPGVSLSAAFGPEPVPASGFGGLSMCLVGDDGTIARRFIPWRDVIALGVVLTSAEDHRDRRRSESFIETAEHPETAYERLKRESLDRQIRNAPVIAAAFGSDAVRACSQDLETRRQVPRGSSQEPGQSAPQ